MSIHWGRYLYRLYFNESFTVREFAWFSARAIRNSQGTDEWRHSSNNSVQPPLITRRNERALLEPYLLPSITPVWVSESSAARSRPFPHHSMSQKKTLPVKGHFKLIHCRAFVSVEKLISSLRMRACINNVIIIPNSNSVVAHALFLRQITTITCSYYNLIQRSCILILATWCVMERHGTARCGAAPRQ